MSECITIRAAVRGKEERDARIGMTNAPFLFHRPTDFAVQAKIGGGGTRKTLTKAMQIQEEREP